MLSAFYPGAGTDVCPPILFRSIKTWHYMDSQPRSEFGDDDYSGFYRPKFLGSLFSNMKMNNYMHIATEQDMYTFYNSEHEQTIYYNTNSVFPKDLNSKQLECDALILCGYELTNPPENFVASYPNIITDSHTSEEVLEGITNDIYTMVYNPEWEDYWKDEIHTTETIQKNIHIVKHT